MMSDEQFIHLSNAITALRRELQDFRENMETRLTDIEDDLDSVVQDVDEIQKKVVGEGWP